MIINISSSAFQEGDRIPVKYTCDGQDISPPLTFGEPPPGTKSLALVMDDPDAPRGIFNHWVIFNIPAATRELAEGIPNKDTLQDGTQQGKNDSGTIGYSGPCPPRNTLHHYRFNYYALDTPLKLQSGIQAGQFYLAIAGHVLAQGKLTVLFKH